MLLTVAPHAAARGTTGVLILAHGHEQQWNAQVQALARTLQMPVEVAFGMAHKSAMEQAVRSLEKQNVQRIVAVPLYVSSHSSIIRASSYLLGLSAEAPPELELFNSMSHGLQNPHGGHTEGGPPADLSPIRSSVPIVMTSALDDHTLVAAILIDRARTISRRPATETVILVGHGANSDSDNLLWKRDLDSLAGQVAATLGFAASESVILLDDASPELRERAAEELRNRVRRASERGTALILPVLLSRGGIEAGLSQRLKGLEYRLPDHFLLPDARVAEWVRLKVDEGIDKLERSK
jgi:sirohydrochlorin ferrochelatase